MFLLQRFLSARSMISCIVMFVYLRALKHVSGLESSLDQENQTRIHSIIVGREKTATAELIEFSEGLELPGELGPDNKLHWGET